MESDETVVIPDTITTDEEIVIPETVGQTDTSTTEKAKTNVESCFSSKSTKKKFKYLCGLDCEG